MKKKAIVVLLFIICSVYLYFSYAYGWLEFRKNTDTPKEFLSHTVVRKENYTNDSIEISKHLKFLLLKHEDFFYSKAYFDSTELIIDSILYSPDLKKLAVVVVTKNPTRRQLVPDARYEWYFDATCYLGVRQNDTIALSWIGPVFTNSSNEQTISNEIRDACFRTFVTKDTSDAYAYNLNDIRFWDSKIWNETEDKKIKRKEFEEEKKKHPENVYEPKK